MWQESCGTAIQGIKQVRGGQVREGPDLQDWLLFCRQWKSFDVWVWGRDWMMGFMLIYLLVTALLNLIIYNSATSSCSNVKHSLGIQEMFVE